MPGKSTGHLLTKLRAVMRNTYHVSSQLNAYIVPTGDAHQSEYVAECDQRRVFLTGFTGSCGTAVVTTSHAALWTDGRYYLQAEAELDCNWTLMRDGLPDTPSMSKWLNKVLPLGSGVGCDPRLMSFELWKSLSKGLKAYGCQLIAVEENLVDLIWNDRPDLPSSPLLFLPIELSGCEWQQKVTSVREKLKEKDAAACIVTALDDVAWLFNMRGSDIMYNPVFLSYAVVTMSDVHLFLEEGRLGRVRQHLQCSNDDCGVHIPFSLSNYSDIWTFICSLVKSLDGKIMISEKSSFAVVSLVPKDRRVLNLSPVSKMKSVKNSTEVEGMKKAQILDAVALCEFLHWMEQEVPKGTITEISAADKAEELRRQQQDFVSLSFPSISSSGSNGSIIHYKPSNETNKPVTCDEVFLFDSGAQYKFGTTDTTRTMHFGTPSRHEQECFTRVLKGHIRLSSIVFPAETKGYTLDASARMSLWEIGLDYRHGTGHGVGAFLNVHEGPCGIRPHSHLYDVALEENMILTDEPGYYEDGKFGIRIENCIQVVKAETKHRFQDKQFFTFRPITLVPIQTKMIDPTLLAENEVAWLNQYHCNVKEVVGDELKAQGKLAVYSWLSKNTEPLG